MDCAVDGEMSGIMNWQTSSYSGAANQCVEIALGRQATAVRDSKHPAGPVLTFTWSQWSAFTSAVRIGQFD